MATTKKTTTKKKPAAPRKKAATTKGAVRRGGKPVVRVLLHVDPKELDIIREGQAASGVRDLDFFFEDDAPGKVWLVFVGKNMPMLTAFHDVVTKRGDLPMKTHGEWFGPVKFARKPRPR